MRPRNHRWYQLPADFASESVAPSSAKDDLSGEIVEASCHSCADLLVGKDTQPFGKDDPSGETVEASCHDCADLLVEEVVPFLGRDDPSGETVEASCHDCADLLVEEVVPFLGRDDLSGETVFPLREYTVSWLIPGAHTEFPFGQWKREVDCALESRRW